MEAFNLIALFLLIKIIHNIQIYELTRNGQVQIFEEAYVYVNISSYKNNEYFYFQIYYDDQSYYTKKMEYITYSLKNEINLDDFKNFTDVNIYRDEGYKTIKIFFKVQKVDNYKYILFYLKHYYFIFYTIYYSGFSLIELPKYGNLTVKYTAKIYYNLTSFNNDDNIYIQIQIFDYIAKFSEELHNLDFYVLQTDELGEYESYSYDRIKCINLNYKKDGNISYTFYYTFKKKYNFLLMEFGYLFSLNFIDFYIKNTKDNEYAIDNNQNKSNKKMVLYIVISFGIVALIGMFVFIYIFVYRPHKEVEKISDDSETPLKYLN